MLWVRGRLIRVLPSLASCVPGGSAAEAGVAGGGASQLIMSQLSKKLYTLAVRE